MTDLKKMSVRFTPDQQLYIEKSAAAFNITPTEFVRRQTLGQTLAGNTCNTYAAAVEAAAQCIPGVSRTQLEWAVSKVIVTMMNPPR